MGVVWEGKWAGCGDSKSRDLVEIEHFYIASQAFRHNLSNIDT
jgi:hypothetical protein